LVVDFTRDPPHIWPMTYTVQDAQTNLDQLFAEADAGQQVVIEREGKPSIRLAVVAGAETPAQGSERAWERVLGQLRGLVEYDDSAFDPLTDEELMEHGFGFMLEKKLASGRP